MSLLLKPLIIFLSFLLAWALMILPLPQTIQFFRPEWMMLILIYWILCEDKLSVWMAFGIGLMSDILNGSVIGQYALIMTLVAYLTQIFKNRWRLFSFWQQTLLILVLVGIAQLTLLIIQWFLGHPPASMLFWCSTLSSTLIWPILFKMLYFYEKKYH